MYFYCKKCGTKFYSASDEGGKCPICGGELVPEHDCDEHAVLVDEYRESMPAGNQMSGGGRVERYYRCSVCGEEWMEEGV